MRYFVAVAEELHFGRAAARLHLAQQPLSSQIKDLEAEIGVQLFIRAENRIRLSAAGVSFLEEARTTLAQAERAAEAAKRAASGMTGRIRIGFCSSAVGGFLPFALKRFKQESPEVEVQLRETYNQLNLLEARSLDLAFMHLSPDTASYSTKVLFREKFVIAVSKAQGLPPAPDWTVLKDLPLVSLPLEKVPEFGALLKTLRQEIGYRPTLVQEAGDKATLLSLVASGLGIAFVPEHVAHGAVPAGIDFLPLTPQRSLELGAVWHKANDSPALRRFLRGVVERLISAPHGAVHSL